MVPSYTISLSAFTVTLVLLAATIFSSKRSFAGEIGTAAGAESAAAAGTVDVASWASSAEAALFGKAGSAEVCCGAPVDAGEEAALTVTDCASRFAARHARKRRVPNQPPASSKRRMTTEAIQASQGCSGVTTGGLPVHTGTVWRSPTAEVYSATMFSSSSPRYRATARTNPRLKTPPGS